MSKRAREFITLASYRSPKPTVRASRIVGHGLFADAAFVEVEIVRVKGGRLLAKLLLSLAVLALLLGLVEGAVRARQRIRYGTFGQIHEVQIDEATGLPVLVAGHRTATMSINSLGFRGPEPAPAAHSGHPRETAAGALARVELPDATRKFISDRLWAGASIIVSDKAASDETGAYTDFIVKVR